MAEFSTENWNINEMFKTEEELREMNIESSVLTTEIDVPDFIEHCVDVPRFLGCCGECPNFGKTWSCPPYDFDPMDIWKQYSRFYLYAIKTITPPELLEKTYELDELLKLGAQITLASTKGMADHLEAEQKKYPGSRIIGGGRCVLCGDGNCARMKDEPCRFPDRMTYSIESLGGNVQETLKRYLDEDIYWGADGHLAPSYIRIGGLLKK